MEDSSSCCQLFFKNFCHWFFLIVFFFRFFIWVMFRELICMSQELSEIRCKGILTSIKRCWHFWSKQNDDKIIDRLHLLFFFLYSKNAQVSGDVNFEGKSIFIWTFLWSKLIRNCTGNYYLLTSVLRFSWHSTNINYNLVSIVQNRWC